MGYVVKMPKLGLEMERGVVLEWMVDVDEAVTEGDALVEVESEKSIGEVDVREDGALREVYVEEGQEVPPGTPIGIVAAPDTDISDLRAEAEADLQEDAPEFAPSEPADADTTAAASETEAATATGEGSASETRSEDATAQSAADESEPADATAEELKVSPRARTRAAELGVDLTSVDGTGPMGSITEGDVEAAADSASAEGGGPSGGSAATEEIRASPRAKKRAQELGVELAAIEGTGPMESITEADVEAAAESAAAETAAEPALESRPTPADAGEIQWVGPGDGLADRYQRTTAVASPAAANALFETMEAVRTAFEEQVTMTDVLVVLASVTLDDQPLMNGTYAEATHQVQETQNIALVADIDGDPVSVVVPDARNQSLTDVVETRRTADESPRDSDPTPNRATFTVANAAEAGATGRLINPPAVAALEIDPTGQRAVPNGDDVDLQPLVGGTLTVDRRAVGENEATAFLDRFFERAERASELVLESYRGRE